MIDTLRFRTHGDIRNVAGGVLGWERTRISARDAWDTKGEPTVSQGELNSFEHPETGVRLLVREGCSVTVEASLPRVLFGCNGRLLRNDSDIAASCVRLAGMLDQVIDPLVPHLVQTEAGLHASWRISRIDLVWQFRGVPSQWIVAHASTGHPKVRRTAQQFFSESLLWPGKECAIRMYDKELEANGTPGEVVRVEYQLRGKECSRTVETASMRIPSFSQLWAKYREISLGFQPVRLPNPKRLGVHQLLAILHSEGVTIEGVPILDWARAFTVSHRGWYRLRNKVKAYRVEHFRIDWEALVPATGPADAPEVLPKEKVKVAA